MRVFLRFQPLLNMRNSSLLFSIVEGPGSRHLHRRIKRGERESLAREREEERKRVYREKVEASPLRR